MGVGKHHHLRINRVWEDKRIELGVAWVGGERKVAWGPLWRLLLMPRGGDQIVDVPAVAIFIAVVRPSFLSFFFQTLFHFFIFHVFFLVFSMSVE